MKCLPLLLLSYIVTLLQGPASCLAGSLQIPSGRTIHWAPGLEFRGGIPQRTVLINVKNAPYNAKGDGVTDDTKAIQRALNAAAANQVLNSVGQM